MTGGVVTTGLPYQEYRGLYNKMEQDLEHTVEPNTLLQVLTGLGPSTKNDADCNPLPLRCYHHFIRPC